MYTCDEKKLTCNNLKLETTQVSTTAECVNQFSISMQWNYYSTVFYDKIIMPSERRQIIKSAYCMILFVLNSRKCKLVSDDRKQISSCLGMERGWG